ncbi:hypothetical protein V2J09_002890 [Rumex salicifolius]
MAGGGFVNRDPIGRVAHYDYKITPQFILACILAALGGSLFGYDLGVSGGMTSMDDFLEEFFPEVYKRKRLYLHETDYCKYNNQVLTLFTSCLYYAALISTFAASYSTKNLGRRASILVGSISFFFGGLVNASAVNVEMLIIGRILLGIGIGFGNQAVPLYLSEMAPAKIRGAVSQLFQLTTCIGILAASFINYVSAQIHPWGWRLSVGLAIVPALLMFVGGISLPETPNSLVEQGRLEEGRRVLEKVRGTANVDAEFSDLIDASEMAQSVKNPFGNLLKRKNRPQLVIALCIPAFQQLTGMNSILFYAPVFFQTLGFTSNVSLWSAAITYGALVVAAFISMSLVDYYGRRTFFIQAGIEMLIEMDETSLDLCIQVAVAIFLHLYFGEGKEMPKGVGIVLVLCIVLFVNAYGRSWGPLGWLVPSEIFPLETRSAGQSVVVCVNMIFTALIAQSFLPVLCHLQYKIFLLFAVLIFVMTSFIYFFLPETKQVPIEEVVFLFRSHWFWRRFVTDDDVKAYTGDKLDRDIVKHDQSKGKNVVIQAFLCSLKDVHLLNLHMQLFAC